MSDRFISYLRVSTVKQGLTGLGMQAQREAVTRFMSGACSELLAEFVEVESGRKSDKERPQLAAALIACEKQKATLVVAKLDRLARDTKLILSLVDSGVAVKFLDFPDLPEGAAGRFMLTQLAAVAEFERRLIGERTRAALAAAKQRGVRLGIAGPANLKRNVEERKTAAAAFANRLRPVLVGFRAAGLSQTAQVEKLNDLCIGAPQGGSWSRMQLQRVLARLQPAPAA